MYFGLEKSPWSAVKEQLDRTLKTDPTLSSLIKTWGLFDGDRRAVYEPTVAQMPWVGIESGSGQSSWVTEGQHQTAFVIEVNLAWPSLNASEFLDAWWAIVQAIFPKDEARRAAVDRFETEHRIQATLQGSPPAWQIMAGNQALAGSGKIVFTMHVDTRF